MTPRRQIAIEGLRERRSLQRWLWLLIPALAVAAFVVHIVMVGQDIASDRQAEAAQTPVAETTSAEGDRVGGTAVHVEGADQAPDEASPVVEAPPAAAPEPRVEEHAPVEAAEEAPAASTIDPALAGKAQPGAAGKLAGEIKKGETLSVALTARGLGAGPVQAAINALSKVFDFRRCRPGDRWEVEFDAAHKITALRYQPDPEVRYIATFDPKANAFTAVKKDVPLEIKVVGVGGTVRSSLHKALSELGERNRLISGFIDRFAWDIDFASETRSGDTFRVLVEKVYLDGKFLRYGHILAAEYSRQGKPLRVYAFDDEGQKSYHDVQGNSVKRTLLRNPVKFSRISSRFGKRMHPILKTWKMHNGVDYAAPAGTPVHVVASGTVIFAGNKGANGNLVGVRHAGGLTSYYAHLSKFAPDIKPGQKVTQGDVIGFVGSTGRSTGPHLHLGMQQGAAFVDPLSVQSTRGVALAGPKLAKFKTSAKELDRQLDRVKIQPPSEGPDEPEPTSDDSASLDEEDVALP